MASCAEDVANRRTEGNEWFSQQIQEETYIKILYMKCNTLKNFSSKPNINNFMLIIYLNLHIKIYCLLQLFDSYIFLDKIIIGEIKSKHTNNRFIVIHFLFVKIITCIFFILHSFKNYVYL